MGETPVLGGIQLWGETPALGGIQLLGGGAIPVVIYGEAIHLVIA